MFPIYYVFKVVNNDGNVWLHIAKMKHFLSDLFVCKFSKLAVQIKGNSILNVSKIANFCNWLNYTEWVSFSLIKFLFEWNWCFLFGCFKLREMKARIYKFYLEFYVCFRFFGKPICSDVAMKFKMYQSLIYQKTFYSTQSLHAEKKSRRIKYYLIFFLSIPLHTIESHPKNFIFSKSFH